MGLDVRHIKFVHEPIEKGNHYLLDDWDSCCNVPFKYYEKFINNYVFGESLLEVSY